MEFWVTQWHPEVQSTGSFLVKSPEEMWKAVHDFIELYPHEHITIVPAD